MTKRNIVCDDEYEAKKLSSLIYAKDQNEIFITGVLEIIDNEVIILSKDKSAHSILLKDKSEAESFADFIQSVLDREDRIFKTQVTGNIVEITKE